MVGSVRQSRTRIDKYSSIGCAVSLRCSGYERVAVVEVEEAAGCRIVGDDFGRRQGGVAGGIKTAWLRSASSDDSDCQSFLPFVLLSLRAAAAAALSGGCPHRGAV